MLRIPEEERVRNRRPGPGVVAGSAAPPLTLSRRFPLGRVSRPELLKPHPRLRPGARPPGAELSKAG